MSSSLPVQPTRELACAKINLFLHVTGRRSDGYHLLDSVAVFAEAADVLTVVPDAALRLSVTGPFASVLQQDAGENLVLRAARVLLGEASAPQALVPGAALRLEKHLPVASGIGGGSADAAATLRLLRRFWRLDRVDEPLLHAMAASLGADVPVCLAGRPARMQGVGEILQQVPDLPALGLVLLNCREAVSTPAVFRARAEAAAAGGGFSAPVDLPRGWTDASDLACWLSTLSNDLEAPARRLCPPIGTSLEALRALPGCRFVRMSGSGATCFALFDDPEKAREAHRSGAWPAHWWAWAGGLQRAQP